GDWSERPRAARPCRDQPPRFCEQCRTIPPDRSAILGDAVGLTAEQAAERRTRFGYTDIVLARPSTWRDVAGDTLRDPMIWFLVAVGLLYAFLGDFGEAAVLGFALVPLVGMD